MCLLWPCLFMHVCRLPPMCFAHTHNTQTQHTHMHIHTYTHTHIHTYTQRCSALRNRLGYPGPAAPRACTAPDARRCDQTNGAGTTRATAAAAITTTTSSNRNSHRKRSHFSPEPSLHLVHTPLMTLHLRSCASLLTGHPAKAQPLKPPQLSHTHTHMWSQPQQPQLSLRRQLPLAPGSTEAVDWSG
ncbi:hypothetical protein PTSG_11907 [Salpingoeca rosetta]|uniref:Secreted protein n=1 Tax=Salpingoeca rosetta (strain ATCC 50818 / BSB-021) TaxID=946362 RepID=F2U321_SALR5|nr:uncharacterized protein PTSG_11907 [Salpingoeca rosetta]EGD82015.1 hypothetical protein PTSG_11907 [Salpingoeca rosetta]|eukprot:XP_004996198.1 hypothetical protein PTSG_11907 [Salpingoeca rosetta]